MTAVLLVNPGTDNKYFHPKSTLADRVFEVLFNRLYDRKFRIPMGANCTTMPPVTLYALQALFSVRCETKVIDEQVTDIDFDQHYDLVCITSTTTQINRARMISEKFRARGTKTAIGGVHASCLPDECSLYFDVVCIGEAEMYIDRLMSDLTAGSLAKRYETNTFAPMEDIPFYEYEIGGGRYLPFHVINFSRGCVFNCDFCSIKSTLGTFRTRPVEAVVAEIVRKESKYVWFPDATLTANPRRARELFKALVPLKIKWVSQITMNIATNYQLLDLMAESGCMLASIGFESLNDNNIKTSKKSQNRVEDYYDTINALHARNIAIEGNFAFGFDEDGSDVFDKTADFIINSGIDLPELYMLTPYPDTDLYKKLLQEGRIVDFDWSHYDNTHFLHLPVFEPKNLSRQELLSGCRAAERVIYSRINTIKRLARSGVMHLPVLGANWIYATRMARKGHLSPTARFAC
jgi:radical SAM superfamily enzyme YgiQ (UPF0313 family)